MGKSQRTKGATFEREIAHRFRDAVGVDCKRNIGQARDGGNDLDVGPLVVECKRRKTLTTLRAWYAQAHAAMVTRNLQSGRQDLVPVVVARADGQLEPFVVLTLGDFLALTKGALGVTA